MSGHDQQVGPGARIYPSLVERALLMGVPYRLWVFLACSGWWVAILSDYQVGALALIIACEIVLLLLLAKAYRQDQWLVETLVAGFSVGRRRFLPARSWDSA